MEEEKNLSESGKDYFLRMRKTAQRMQDLIEDLLTYSRTKSGEHPLVETNLNDLLKEVETDMEDLIAEKKAKIKIAPLGTIQIIPFQLRQLFVNLIGNSFKFAKENTPPVISIEGKTALGKKLKYDKLAPDKEYCHIVVTDNGIGFDPQYSERIFEVFQRLHTFEEYHGTGIGLAICKRIVENHKGFITATSDFESGARFDIFLQTSR